MNHADFETLVAYWLGDLDEAAEAALEEHYLGCAACSERLAGVEAMADGVRRAFDAGHVRAVLTPAFVDRLHAAGLKVREYRVARNGSVNCGVAPEDQVLLSRLEAPLQGVARIDLISGDRRLEDVPFDPASGEVVVVPGIAHIRTLPAHRQVLRLVAVGADGERVLGEYTFNHSPMP